MFSGFGRPISETSIGVPIETFEGEKRVALSPESVKRLKKDGFTINIQKGAGVNAGFLDEAYTAEGANIVENAYKSDIVFKVRPPLESEYGKLEKDSGLISYLYPKKDTKLVDELKASGVIDKAVFAFYLTDYKDQSKMQFGGHDINLVEKVMESARKDGD